MVAVDLGDTPVKATRRISFGRWFRLRHGVENTKTALVSIGQQVNAHSCSALKIELRRDRVLWWRGLLNCLAITARCVKNHREQVGLPANIALASNPDAAVHVARGIKGTTVISPGEEATKLAPLPLRLLGGSRLHG